MSISQLARTIQESPTLALNEEARLLRERGEPVIHLGIGEPKNKAPIAAILSAAARLKTGDVKYAPADGLPSLKKAIIHYTEENYGRLAAPENVIVSAGEKQSLFNLLFAITDPQDEIVVLVPYWVSYPEMVRMVRGIPVVVTPEDGSFVPQFEEIARVVSSYTKAIIVNSPNNPSGAIYPPALIAQLVELCEQRDIFLIMDDIYHKLVFDGQRARSAYEFTARAIDESRIVLLNGVSKIYGMTGFRIGWAVGPRRVVEVMTAIQGQTTSCPATLSQTAAEGALTGVQSVVESLRLSIQNNRDVMLDALRTFAGVQTVPPRGTFYCLPDFRAYSASSMELAHFLLKKALVVTVPGAPFGVEGHLRLSYSGTVKEITEGIERMKWALDPNAPNEIYIGDRKLIRDWL